MEAKEGDVVPCTSEKLISEVGTSGISPHEGNAETLSSAKQTNEMPARAAKLLKKLENESKMTSKIVNTHATMLKGTFMAIRHRLSDCSDQEATVQPAVAALELFSGRLGGENLTLNNLEAMRNLIYAVGQAVEVFPKLVPRTAR